MLSAGAQAEQSNQLQKTTYIDALIGTAQVCVLTSSSHTMEAKQNGGTAVLTLQSIAYLLHAIFTIKAHEGTAFSIACTFSA